MRAIRFRKLLIVYTLGTGFLLPAASAKAQSAERLAPSAALADQSAEIRALADSVRELQAQVQALSAQLNDLRSQQGINSARAARLPADNPTQLADSTTSPTALPFHLAEYEASPVAVNRAQPSSSSVSPAPREVSEDRIARLEENQQFIDAKVNDQYQTKVESGSKYRLRLSGIVLLNLYDTRGTVDNQDFPQIASAMGLLGSHSSFGGSLRQSQLGLEAFGPDIAGAHTSANIRFDFAGGFPDTPNGVVEGLVRLRTATIRFDWANTSLIGGQDQLFFAPLVPTSIASIAVPALSYNGNLWSWTPQLRIEHKFALTENSAITLQAGILDALSGDVPFSNYERYPSWGEQSGQPAYAARIAWNQHALGQNFVLGAGGYYGRQNWGFNRTFNTWAGTADLTLPLGKFVALTAAFYRGRALGGLAGGIGQSVLLSGNLALPATRISGLDSMGGWAQLKFNVRPNFELNAALGIDNPFAREFRPYSTAESYYGKWLTKNVSPFVNFIYHVRSDVLFSLEYQHLQTFALDDGSQSANHINMSVGYVF